MKRIAESILDRWIKEGKRNPLVIRGARQVGKTWLARNCALRHKKDLIEINFERDPLARIWFSSNNPLTILGEVSLALNRPIVPENALLFLDEIQAAGEILAKLRWFAEEMPQLAVIAAGSLLEFTLLDHAFSMPVGRIKFLHMEPMCFTEFLDAHGQTTLHEWLRSWRWGDEFSPTLHRQAQSWFHRYGMIGGMPNIVNKDVQGSSAEACRELQLDLVATYRADFAKYSGRIRTEILDAALQAVSRSLGRKFVYAHAGEGLKDYQVKTALRALASAKVCHFVRYSAANGLPLGGEIKESFHKVILNDIGLLHALIRTPASGAFPGRESIAPQIRSQLAEQITGQQLRMLGPFSGDGPQLYYWQREGGRPGEIDFLVQIRDIIIPVELKSGAAGSMKSLHQFMHDKRLERALRFDQNPPSQLDMSVKTTQRQDVRYRLFTLPHYMAAFADRLA